MKIARVSADFFRQAPSIRFEGVSPAARREVVRYTRRFTRITRLQETHPVKSLNGHTSSASPSRKPNPLKHVKKVNIVTSTRAAWRNNKALVVAKFVKAYNAYDRISPIGVDSYGFLVYLSDIVDPERWLDFDFDARQEAEELEYRRFEQHDVRNEVVVKAVDRQVEMTDWDAPLQIPQLKYWDGDLAPLSFWGDGAFSLLGWRFPPLPTWNKQHDQAVTLGFFGNPWPARSRITPADIAKYGLLNQHIIDEPMFEPAPLPVANEMTPPPTPSSTYSPFAAPAWPPVANDVPMTPPPDSFLTYSLPVVEPALLPVVNDVPMSEPHDSFPKYSPFAEPASFSVANDMTAPPASFPTYPPPDFDSELVNSCFSSWATPPTVANNVNLTFPSAFPQSFCSSVGANALQQPTVNQRIDETSSTKEAIDAAKIASIAAVYPEYQGLLEEVAKFEPGATKDPGSLYAKLENESWEDDFDGRTLNSLSNYSSHPWRYSLKPTPAFPCPIPGVRVPALIASRRTDVAKHYTDLWRDHPEVWQALLGTMLQEGVTIDNLLLYHQGEKAEALDYKTWIIDHSRFDVLHHCGQQEIHLSPGTSGEFHKAPQGQGKAKLYHDEVHLLKNQPLEIQVAFRKLVSVWLSSKTEERLEIFRGIARKAGWCPQDEYRVVVLRNFIVDFFKDRTPELAWFYYQAHEYIIKRFPRFFAAVVMEEGIDYDLSQLC